MQTKYFRTAWQDIRDSPKWLSKIMLLALVSLIPIFGWIVVYGYLYGWARDMAWGIHAPLPPRIFGNEDHRLYSRGFFALIIVFIGALIPGIVDAIGSIVSGLGLFGATAPWAIDHAMVLASLLSTLIGFVITIASIGLGFFIALFEWVGIMRMSIYGRLSAGFQIGKIWAMIRHDFNGIMRILGMAILLLLVGGALVFIIVFVAILAMTVLGFAFSGDTLLGISINPDGGPVHSYLLAVIPVLCILLLLFAFIVISFSIFSNMMIARSLGYWVQQFNVAAWRGQDDPMPFEVAQQPPGEA